MKNLFNTLLLATATLLSCATAQAEETPIYGFVASGFSQSNIEFAVGWTAIQTQSCPALRAGTGQEPSVK